MLISRLKSEKTMIGAGVMSVGIFIGSVFGYIIQVFLGRFLSIEDFGTYNSLLSLTVILAIPSTALVTSMIKLVANLRVADDFEKLTKIFWSVSKYFLLIGFFLALSVLVGQKFILDYLNIADHKLIYPFAVYTAFLLLTGVPRAYLQGLLRYKAYSVYSFFTIFIKLVITMSVVLLGYKVAGVFYGMALASLAGYLAGILLLKKNLRNSSSQNLVSYFKQLVRFSMTVFVIRAGLTILSSVDLVLVKHFFSPTEAGIYAGIVTIGKIILFGTGIVGTVMFPIISDAYAKKANYYKTFSLFLISQVFLVVLSVAVFFILPKFITVTMFGKGYLPAVEFLPKFSIFIGLFAILSFIYQFLLAVEKTSVYKVLIAAVLAQIVLLNVFHDSLMQVINVNIFVLLGTIIVSLMFIKNPVLTFVKDSNR